VTDGFVIPAGGGDRTGNGNILKVGAKHGAFASAFEVSVFPGFDVGAHLHAEAEEFFFILDGELDLLAFEPRVRTEGDWVKWESKNGDPVVRGGPGSFMYVPSGCPHAFANPGTTPARMLFCVAPAGHEHYFEDLAATLGSRGFSALEEVRARHGIEQITPMGMHHRSR
jgi:oxalate decarboxylase/phosphoglucose isomerase-like protein (cupin superfamily)